MKPSRDLSQVLYNKVLQNLQKDWQGQKGALRQSRRSLAINRPVLRLNATMLYADIDNSTGMVARYGKSIAVGLYKVFLQGTSELVESMGGKICTLHGDAIMACFLGESRNYSAVACSLQINYMVKHLVNSAIRELNRGSYRLKHAVGIDTSEIWVTRAGTPSMRDLIWVGEAANYSAKLTKVLDSFPSLITTGVYEGMRTEVQLDKKLDLPVMSGWKFVSSGVLASKASLPF